jgi:hypothetical protein
MIDRKFARRAVPGLVMLLATLYVACGPASAEPDAAKTAGTQSTTPEMTLDTFLDRLMQSESGGRLAARNPLSTAVGPFQFIASTWLQIARSSFATETAELKPTEVLDLRTDMTFARRAAKIYTEANAVHLVANGHLATFANLRLAHLVGPGGAVKVLSAKSDALVASVLGPTVIGANPFMRSMTADDLIARSARDIAVDARLAAGITPSSDAVEAAKVEMANVGPMSPDATATGQVKKAQRKKAEPRINVECSLARASCRRWLALAKRVAKRSRRASRE